MKIRSGFVSNSSTSSFVVVGFEVEEERFSNKDYLIKLFEVEESDIPKDNDGIDDLLYDSRNHKNIFLALHDEDGATKGNHFIGILVDDAEDGQFGDASYDFDELKEKAEVLKQNLGADDAKVVLKVGVRCC